MCYIQICVIMRCVIKGLHCVLNFCPLDFFSLSNSADQDEMLHLFTKIPSVQWIGISHLLPRS